MERQVKYQDKILKFLPKAALNLPFSPNKEKRFTGPIIIPYEARLRGRRHRKTGDDGDDDDVSSVLTIQEPSSPKISCMGQIKHKTKAKSLNKKVNNGSFKTNTTVTATATTTASKPSSWSPRGVTKQASKIKRMFSGVMASKLQPGRRSGASTSSPRSDGHQELDRDRDYQVSLPDRAPSLSQMKMFASGRDRLSGFDWAAVQIRPVDAEHRNVNADDDDDNYDVMIPFSAPLLTTKSDHYNDNNNNNNDSDGPVPLQPRKEINLWKRRTMAPPRPLDLNTMMIRAN